MNLPRPTTSSDAEASIARAAEIVAASQRAGGLFFVAGNGGSFADALHIAGELAKSFEIDRPLSSDLQARLAQESGSTELGAHLQQGIRVLVLGTNVALASAIDNDLGMRHVGFAQELCALARPGDVLLAISTSGRSPNVLNAVYVARAVGARSIALTGADSNPLSGLADVVIRAAGATTAEIQTHQVAQYHELCRLIERNVFAS